MARMTGAKFMADTLKAYGVTHVFLVPAILRRALAEMDLIGIKRVITHGEKAAAYMADGYARASGKPGICMAQSVGAANLAAGLQDAYLGLSPVIALTGHKRTDEQYRNAYQEIEHSKPFASVTKFSAVVDNAEQLPHLLRQAFREATTGAPAPVHLDIQGMTGDFATEAEADLEVMFESTFAQRPAFRPEADPESVRAAALALTSAQRPVIVAGGGVTSSGAQREIVELAEMLNIPVATSLNAKGTIPDNHPLAVGVVGSYSRWCANRVVSEADLVFYVGSHTGSQVTNEWRVPSPGTPVIQLDIDPSELGRTYPAQVAMHGDAKATLRRMIEALEPIGGHADWVGRVQQLVQEWRDDVAPRVKSEAIPIIPERLCNEITKFLPSDAMLVADTGHAGIWTGSMIDFNHPTQEYIRCAGSLGWGLSAAMGAKCALPDRPVLCFTGDGGFWYHIAELETAVRNNINLVTVINNNSALSQDQRGDERAYAGMEGGHPEDLWQFTDTNFARLAESIGCFGIRVERPGDIQSALEQAFASGRPAVVDVVTDPLDSLAPVPWSP